jgi:hypothetical protein
MTIDLSGEDKKSVNISRSFSAGIDMSIKIDRRRRRSLIYNSELLSFAGRSKWLGSFTSNFAKKALK